MAAAAVASTPVSALSSSSTSVKRRLDESDAGSAPALTIHLWAHGFSLGANAALYPYDASTRSILHSIDRRRLCPELLDLLEDQPTAVFSSGAVVVELHDHRTPLAPHAPSAAPAQVRRVQLEADMESLVADAEAACAAHPDWSERELLAFESRVLTVARRDALCLDPSPEVARTAQLLAYNRNKFNYRPRRSLTSRSRAQSRAGAAFVVPLSAQPLLKFLLSYRNPPAYVFGGLSPPGLIGSTPSAPAAPSPATPANGAASGVPAPDSSEVLLNSMSQRLTQAPSRYVPASSRALRFQRSANRAVIIAEMAARQHGHELALRCGSVMVSGVPPGHAQGDSTAATDPVRVVLGGAHEAAAFLRRLPAAAERDGYVLGYDSADPHVQPPPAQSLSAGAAQSAHTAQAGLSAHYAAPALPSYASSTPKMVMSAASTAAVRTVATRKAPPKHKAGAVPAPVSAVPAENYAQMLQARANATPVSAVGVAVPAPSPSLGIVRTTSAPPGAVGSANQPIPANPSAIVASSASTVSTVAPGVATASAAPPQPAPLPQPLPTGIPVTAASVAAARARVGASPYVAPPSSYAPPKPAAVPTGASATSSGATVGASNVPAPSTLAVPTLVPAPSPTPTLLTSASAAAPTAVPPPAPVTYASVPLYSTVVPPPTAAPPARKK